MYFEFIKPYLYFKNDLTKFINESGVHEKWTMIIPTSGSFRVKMQNKEDVISKYDIVIFPAGMYYKRKIIEPISYFCIQFDIENDSPDAFSLPFGKQTSFDTKRLVHNLEMLSGYLDQIDPRSENIKLHILYDILYDITLRQVTTDHLRIEDDTISRIIEYIEGNFNKKISLSDIAPELGITTSGLIYKFKKHTGLKPFEFIIQLRINHAKKLLLQTDLNLTRIAEECGYENMYYFSNAFKKCTGIPPSLFRSQNRL